MALAPSLTQGSSLRRARTGRIALWVLQIGLAGMFLLAGSSKLLGDPAMVGLFDAIGIGQWFRYLTGLIEVGSAVALLGTGVRGVRCPGTRGDNGWRCHRAPLHPRSLACAAGDSAARVSRRRLGSAASAPRRTAGQSPRDPTAAPAKTASSSPSNLTGDRGSACNGGEGGIGRSPGRLRLYS